MRIPLALTVMALLVMGVVASACAGAIAFERQPAHDYVYGSGRPLRVAVLDETGDPAWRSSIDSATWTFAAAVPHLWFSEDPARANIVVTVRRYSDTYPPALPGYRFEPGVAGFAAVYDGNGRACNFPPSPLPLGCDGEITHADIYLNDAIAPGADLEGRRLRLLTHELGHALGLTRHAPDVDAANLAARYGW